MTDDWLLVKLPMRPHDPWPWLEDLIAWNVANGSRASIGDWEKYLTEKAGGKCR